jgi:GDP-L-fucose synthase
MGELSIFSKISHDARIFVAGHKGLVGSSIVRCLQRYGYKNLVLRTRQELDLLDQRAVHAFFAEERIDFVFLCAARVGGILDNAKHQADFLYENMMISANVIYAAAQYDVKKLLYLGSSCIYPKFSPQPIREDSLLSGPLEPTNEGYALAKIAGLKLCEKFYQQYGKAFISVMPTNMYGPNDNFHPERSHVVPGMMRRFHEAKLSGAPHVTVWGSGEPRREFLYADDFAEAALVVMEQYEHPATLNVGTGEDVTIRELALLMRDVVGFSGEVRFDTSKPDGTPRKVLDVSRVKALGWAPKVALADGLVAAYAWALEHGAFAQDSQCEASEVDERPRAG